MPSAFPHSSERDLALAELLRDRFKTDSLLEFQVDGDSMFPLLEAGDLVLVESCVPEGLSAGEIAVFVSEGVLKVHRFVDRDGQHLLFKGDRRLLLDPPCHKEALVGRGISVVRQGIRYSLREGALLRISNSLRRVERFFLALRKFGLVIKERIFGKARCPVTPFVIWILEESHQALLWLIRLLIVNKVFRVRG